MKVFSFENFSLYGTAVYAPHTYKMAVNTMYAWKSELETVTADFGMVSTEGGVIE